MIIFSYGSNMNLNRLKERVPSAKKIDTGYIMEFDLKCIKRSIDGSGKATILNSDYCNEKVWGVVYEIDDKDKTSLDKAEGLESGYNEVMVDVNIIDNRKLKSQTYIADKEFIDSKLSPYHWYKEFIITGAIENNLPKDYIEKLKEISSQDDTNNERKLKNESILNNGIGYPRIQPSSHL